MVVEKREDQLCSCVATAAARYSSFGGGDRVDKGDGEVTGSTGGYWWLWSGHRQ